MGEDRSLRTVQLGQFTREHAERVCHDLEAAGIPWTHKEFGRLVRLLSAADWGVRLFVDSRRLDEAKEIVRRLAEAGWPPVEGS
jgi:hypothetical protein